MLALVSEKVSLLHCSVLKFRAYEVAARFARVNLFSLVFLRACMIDAAGAHRDLYTAQPGLRARCRFSELGFYA